MELTQREGESRAQYHKRLIYGKLVDKTLADVDYSELSEYIYGQSYSSDVARRMMYGSKYTLSLQDEERTGEIQDQEILSALDQQLIELRKERQRFFDQRSAFNKVVREQARQEELRDLLMDAVRRGGDLPTLQNVPACVAPSDNDLLISLSDIHYGIEVHNAWNRYSPEICAKMMSGYLERILEIAKTHGSENCVVFNNGDSISGNIHMTVQLANKENAVNQVKGVSELIAEFLAELSRNFNCVRYVSAAGNHSRLNTKENSPIDERLDDLIEWYLQARLQDFQNIHIETEARIDPTMALFDIRGKTYLGVHGDLEKNAAHIAALQKMAGRPIYAILTGHFHHNMTDQVQNTKVLMTGSFLGMDDFCVQKRIVGNAEQMVSVCDRNGVLCHYDIPLAQYAYTT